MERSNNAVAYKMQGLNCCQAVLKAYADVLNVDEKTLMDIASGFAIGMGAFDSTCGALIGANIALGIFNKGARTQSISRILLEKFKTSSKSQYCRVLKGIETGVVLTSCNDCVKNACLALDEVLKENNINIE